MTRKEIARMLDRAAARSTLVEATPATSKQCWYLAGLIEKAGDTPEGLGLDVTNTNAVLTARKASWWIDQYLSAAASGQEEAS